MVFGKYCLLERISVGGMAEVFRAKPLPAHQSGKMLALKRILPHLAEDDEFITMFVDEAKLTVALEHPNIVETYELGNFQKSYYILMEYIAGADVLALQKRLRQNRRIMSVAQACYVAEKIARGLHFAHTACDEEGRPFNIIHRDVSPQNIRLTYDGRVKLIDFGIAKAAVQRTKTQVGVLKGKFGYMSPEQVQGEEFDYRSDVFALGTTLWEMLTNRRLFNGDNEFETLQMVKHPDIPPPSEKNPQVPPRVDDIVLRALHEDRNQRFQSAAKFADALNGFVSNIDRPYTREHLARWMSETFHEELQEERRKRKLYREIKTADDVREFNNEYVEDGPIHDEEFAGESLVEDDERLDDDQIWDPEFAPEEGEDVDPEEFAANHTMVAAGGFDPADYHDEDEDIITLADDDLIELEEGELAEAETSGSLVQPFDASAGASGSSPAAASSSGTQPSAQRPGTKSGGGSDGNAVRIASAVAAVVALLALAFTVSYKMLASGVRGYSQSPGGGSLVISVEPTPTTDGEILVDGRSEGHVAPVTVNELGAGEHEVVARFDGFKEAKKKVDLSDGALRTITLKLEAKPNSGGQVRLDVEGADEPRVFIDGEQAEWVSSTDYMSVKPGRHLVEVIAAGRKVWSRVINVKSGNSMTEQVRLSSTDIDLRIEASESATVKIDGEKVGTTPVVAEGLDPTEIHHLELEAEEGRDDFETHLGFPRLGQGVVDVDFDEPSAARDEDEFGWLTASTGSDWWELLIDGVQTRLATPLGADSKIPVAEGERTVSFRRGNKVHEFEVEIEAGETTSVEETLVFEWSKSEL